MGFREIPFIDEIIAIRRDIHAHPELAFKEQRTADLVASRLQSYGLEVHRGLAGTGVVGVLRKPGAQRGLGLRADMDALPIEEKNDFPHGSVNPGRMHACGHDGHTAILLGAARYMAENRQSLDLASTVYFIFQPAEESEGGAEIMLRDGLFAQFPMDAVFGLHNWPGIPAGELAVLSGPVMAGTCAFEISVHGHGCHAAMPDQGVDTLVVASQLVLALQTVVARNVHPCEAAVLSVTQMHGGDALNVIPDDAVLRGTIRSFKADVQEMIERRIEQLCAGIAAAFGARIAVRFEHRYPATINSAPEAALCVKVAEHLVGADNVRRNELPSMGAEDFAYMLREKPGCYVWLGNGTARSEGSLHNTRYDFNDAVLALGINYWVALAESWR